MHNKPGRPIKEAINFLKSFNAKLAKEIKEDITRIKAEREHISYGAPFSGDASVDKFNEHSYFESCKLFAEIAQFNSELFEFSLIKNGEKAAFLKPDPKYITQISAISRNGHYLGDIHDAVELDEFISKNAWPTNLMNIMNEKFCEQFFSFWHSKTKSKNLFQPDKGRGALIFFLP